MRRVLPLLGFCMAFASTHGVATTLPVIADTYVDQAVPTANFRSNGITAVSGTRTTLIRFDPAQIATSQGDLAILNLKVVLAKNYRDGLSVRQVLTPWSERTVTARTLPTLGSTAVDVRTVLYEEQGATVQMDLSAILAGWRHNPASNYGIAITAGSPAPNVQLGARELKSGATLDIGTVAVLQVTALHGTFGQGSPSINNLGEIIYSEFRLIPASSGNGVSILSTRRGLLVPGGEALRPASDIDDAGEVVWSECCTDPATGYTVYSNERGKIGAGSSPRLDEAGRIAADNLSVNGGFQALGIFERDGTVTAVNIDPAVFTLSELHSVKFSNQLGIAYVGLDSNFLAQLFFSSQGQITHFALPFQHRAIAANRRGEWAYLVANNPLEVGGVLYTSEGKVLWNNAIGQPGMNERGDIVFMQLHKLTKIVAGGEIMLASSHPFDFLRRDRFAYRGVNP